MTTKRNGLNPVEVEGDTAYLGLRRMGGTVQAWAPIDLSDLGFVQSIGTAWTIVRAKHTSYVANRRRKGMEKEQMIYLHRFLMEPPPGMVVDHIDRNGLNNRRSNLRIATYAQNNWNRGMQRGVTRMPDGKWRARVDMTFPTYEEALAARKQWEQDYRLWEVAGWRPGR